MLQEQRYADLQVEGAMGAMEILRARGVRGHNTGHVAPSLSIVVAWTDKPPKRQDKNQQRLISSEITRMIPAATCSRAASSMWDDFIDLF